MTRQDWFFLLAGPGAILLIWALLPWGRSEAWRTDDASQADAVAELVGYAFEGSRGGPSRLLGRSAEAHFRLHNAPVAPRAAWLTPPSVDRAAWSILPARAGLTLELLETLPREQTEPRVLKTSTRPWRERRTVWSRLMPFRRPSAEPIGIGCGESPTTVIPVQLGTDSALAGTWGARINAGGDDRLVLPWSESAGPQGLWFSISGPKPRSIRVGIAARDPNCTGIDCASDRPCSLVPLQGSGSDAVEPPAMIGPLELRDGDLLAIGRTRFLVRTEAPGRPTADGSRHRLELYHVRDPTSPGYFRNSAGHDVYHPNRRALWSVPRCEQQEMLTLAVEPPKTGSEATPDAAELPDRDRQRQSQIIAALRDHDVPFELPAVSPPRKHATSEQAEERALLSLCTTRDDRRKLNARLVADSSTGITLRTSATEAPTRGTGTASSDGSAETLRQDETLIPIGTFGWVSGVTPRELLVDLEGNLLKIAPAAGPRVTRRTRTGLAAFLIFILVLQAWPLTRARLTRRLQSERARTPTEWPAALDTPTLQQVAGIAITSLLFLGASFHLLLGLHPDLVGKPDYLQAFLQGTVAVCVVLAAAAGFSAPYIGTPLRRLPQAAPRQVTNDLERRCAAAASSAAAALLAAAGWWWFDAAGSADGAWFSHQRDLASAAAGASPQAMGNLLFTAGCSAAAIAVVLLLSARLRWSRASEHLARIAIKFPLIGCIALATVGLGLGMLQRSALAFELALLAGLAWYAAVYWAFVRHGRMVQEDDLRRKAAALSMASGLLMLVFLAVFFVVGADLPDTVSFVSVVLGMVVLGGALKIARDERSTSLLRVVFLWVPASILGMGFASFVLTDMGSVAAWIPALLTGFFLWLVRPEEIENRREEPRKALSHLLLALGSGLVLLGLLDVFKRIVQGLDWRALERPQQRLALAEDISYITSGEWITQVRWLASQQDDSLQWVPNVNSDIAIFGLAANLGSGWAIAASVVLLTIAGCAALAADQALREARTVALAGSDRLRPVLYRALGLALGMICVLLISQWLVHLATGVVLHLPITGLVFPWISHGNTTHLLYTAAILLPMAAVTALGRNRNA